MEEKFRAKYSVLSAVNDYTSNEENGSIEDLLLFNLISEAANNLDNQLVRICTVSHSISFFQDTIKVMSGYKGVPVTRIFDLLSRHFPVVSTF